MRCRAPRAGRAVRVFAAPAGAAGGGGAVFVPCAVVARLCVADRLRQFGCGGTATIPRGACAARRLGRRLACAAKAAGRAGCAGQRHAGAWLGRPQLCRGLPFCGADRTGYPVGTTRPAGWGALRQSGRAGRVGAFAKRLCQRGTGAVCGAGAAAGQRPESGPPGRRGRTGGGRAGHRAHGKKLYRRAAACAAGAPADRPERGTDGLACSGPDVRRGRKYRGKRSGRPGRRRALPDNMGAAASGAHRAAGHGVQDQLLDDRHPDAKLYAGNGGGHGKAGVPPPAYAGVSRRTAGAGER